MATKTVKQGDSEAVRLALLPADGLIQSKSLMNTAQIIEQLEAERDAIEAAINALSGSRRGGRRGTAPGRGRRTMSAEARAKISRAQKARWKAQKAKG